MSNYAGKKLKKLRKTLTQLSKTTRSTAHPIRKYYSRSAEFVHLDADTLHRRVDYITDGLNVVLTELAKVVLIEDNKRSLKVKQ